MNKNTFNNTKAFTLVELLLVIALLGSLATVVLITINPFTVFQKLRDSTRARNLEFLERSLQAYYLDHGYYPPAGGNSTYDFAYRQRNPDGSCGGSVSLRFDNSTSPGFLADLDTYINITDWTDPLKPTSHNDRYNCRYVIPRYPDCNTSGHSLVGCKPQKFLLHCTLEYPDSPLGVEDGGTHDQVFEISGPDPWICVVDIPS